MTLCASIGIDWLGVGPHAETYVIRRQASLLSQTADLAALLVAKDFYQANHGLLVAPCATPATSYAGIEVTTLAQAPAVPWSAPATAPREPPFPMTPHAVVRRLVGRGWKLALQPSAHARGSTPQGQPVWISLAAWHRPPAADDILPLANINATLPVLISQYPAPMLEQYRARRAGVVLVTPRL